MSTVNWEEAAECLKILSHPHRLQMIDLLFQQDLSVGELAEACGILQNVASEHLKLMHHRGFLKPVKKGRKVFYTIEEPALQSIMTCIEKRFKY